MWQRGSLNVFYAFILFQKTMFKLALTALIILVILELFYSIVISRFI